MKNDFKGICLFLGFIGLAYVAILILVAIITGAKIFKSIVFIGIFSSTLINFGLTSQVRGRMLTFIRSKFVK